MQLTLYTFCVECHQSLGAVRCMQSLISIAKHVTDSEARYDWDVHIVLPPRPITFKG